MTDDCPSCGAPLKAGDWTCGRCGAPVAGAGWPPAPAARTAEARGAGARAGSGRDSG